MCGRFTLRTPAALMARQFLLPLDRLPPRYNVAPGQSILAIRQTPDGTAREWAHLHWGLVPHWAGSVGSAPAPINARSETAASKPAFRHAFRHRRCLIPADGFFEWKTVRRRKMPYYIRLPDERPFAFAGLWDVWHPEAENLQSCTIVTRAANQVVRGLHERMPVIVSPEDYAIWLDAEHGDDTLLERIYRSPLSDSLEFSAVRTYVNSRKHDDPQCLAAAETERTLFEM